MSIPTTDVASYDRERARQQEIEAEKRARFEQRQRKVLAAANVTAREVCERWAEQAPPLDAAAAS